MSRTEKQNKWSSGAMEPSPAARLPPNARSLTLGSSFLGKNKLCFLEKKQNVCVLDTRFGKIGSVSGFA